MVYRARQVCLGISHLGRTYSETCHVFKLAFVISGSKCGFGASMHQGAVPAHAAAAVWGDADLRAPDAAAIRKAELMAAFEKHGAVRWLCLYSESEGRLKFESPHDAWRAISCLDGARLWGRAFPGLRVGFRK